ncbi:MAG: DUF3147 family protein [Acidimicrobiales bacterium]
MSGKQDDGSIVGLNLSALRDIPRKDIVVRFAFGAGISAVAGAVAIFLGSRVGGVLLAFPAILPATLTLIEAEESEDAAENDDVGAVLGATALAPFAVVLWLLLNRVPAAVALGVAGATWLVVAVGLYLCLQMIRRKKALRSRAVRPTRLR